MATSGYFETLGIARIAGRDFGGEGPNTPRVAIVNEAFARQVFQTVNPVGHKVNGGGVTYRVIGVVKNIRSRTLGEELRPVLFRSLEQTVGSDSSRMGYTLLIHTAENSASLASAVRQEIHAIDPPMAIYNVDTIEEHFKSALFLPRLAGTLFGVFGGVSRRTREIAIRVALGAPVGAVRRMVLRQGMELTLIAVVPGLGIAWAVARFAASRFLPAWSPPGARKAWIRSPRCDTSDKSYTSCL